MPAIAPRVRTLIAALFAVAAALTLLASHPAPAHAPTSYAIVAPGMGDDPNGAFDNNDVATVPGP